MDIKYEDMTLGHHVDNIRIGISNAQLAFEQGKTSCINIDLENIESSYQELKRFVDDCGLKDQKRPKGEIR